jgi:putative two-component system response regulator
VKNQRVLLVDDEPSVLQALSRVLRLSREPWDVRVAPAAEAALEALQALDFDLLVSDVHMPGKDGLQLLSVVRTLERTRDLPVIILTGAHDPDLKRRALDLGATDFLNKPVDPDELTARIRSALRLKTCQDELKAQNVVLERKAAERAAELADLRMSIIWQLGNAAEFRDEDTGQHVVRVGQYARVIANQLGLPAALVEQIFLTAPLHDIGKLGIPDHIFLKRGALAPGEWVVMKRHCEIGAQILRQRSPVMAAMAGGGPGCAARSPTAQCAPNPLLETGAQIALCHHERWDGRGYPGGLRGAEIPIEAHIVAVADMYDAMLSERPYRGAFPEDVVLRTIAADVGGRFDARVHEAFRAALPDMQEIRAEFADTPHRVPAWA